MSPLTSIQLQEIIASSFKEGVVLNANHDVLQPFLVIETAEIANLCTFLRDDPRIYLDFLSCLSGVDHGKEDGRLSVVYHLMSIPNGHRIVLKVLVSRDGSEQIPSVSGVWHSANWHEREAFDLFGIAFSGHPDLRRILMPNDWEGHPLRKDYEDPEFYHGIQVKY